MYRLVLVRSKLLSGHLLGKSCLPGRPYVLFVILVVSCLGLWGRVWVLVVPFPGYFLLLTDNFKLLLNQRKWEIGRRNVFMTRNRKWSYSDIIIKTL